MDLVRDHSCIKNKPIHDYNKVYIISTYYVLFGDESSHLIYSSFSVEKSSEKAIVFPLINLE